LAAIQAVATARLPAAAKPMMAILADSQRPLPERIAILKAATTLADKNFIKPVSVILQNSAAPAELKVEALRTLVSLEPAAARPIAEALLDSPDTTLLTEAILTLGATKEGAQLVGERYLAKKLPRDLFPRVSEALRKFPTDDAISKLNEQVMRGGLLLSLEPAQIDKIRQQVLKQGDAKKGKALYLNSALVACAACHGMEGVGGNIGPDLTRVWDTQTIEKLLESMVTPSKEIKEGYQTYRAATLAGQIFTGLKVFESPREVVLREASGREVRILKADLEEFTATPLSLMPDNAVSQLSYEQFIDLLAFLKSRKEQESLRGAVLEYQVLASGKANLDLPDPLPAEGWKTQAVDPTGLLLHKPQLPAEPAGVLLRTFVYSAKPQTVKATLLADDAVRVQVQGREVFKRTTPKIQPFQTEESWEFPLEQGWNSIVLKLSTTGATHRLGLQLHGESLRIASTPEKPISPPK
jgi:putative heme-binding domain-containing protein